MTKQLSKEDWQYVEKCIGQGFFGSVEMLIDGYKVTFERRLVTKNRLGIMTFVNGVWKAAWSLSRDGVPSEEARRFFQTKKKTAQVFRGKERDKYVRKFGKRALQDLNARLTITYKSPVWSSVRALRAHLVKENQNLELVRPGPTVIATASESVAE